MGQPQPLLHLFSVFSNKQFLLQINVKNVMSIQYTVQRFEHTSSGTLVASHNHYTRAPPTFLLLSTLFHTCKQIITLNNYVFPFFSSCNLEKAKGRCYATFQKMFWSHRGINSRPRVQSRAWYHSAILAPQS